MPPIPRIIRQEDVSLSGSSPNASAEVYGASVGESLQHLGSGLTQVQERLKAEAQADDLQSAKSQLIELKLQYKKEQLDKEMNTVGDISGFNEDIKKRFLLDAQDRTKSLKTEKARKAFANEANAFMSEIDTNSYVLERTRFKEGFADRTNTALKGLAASILTDSTPENFSRVVSDIRSYQSLNDDVAINPAYTKGQIDKHLSDTAQAQITEETRVYGADYAIQRIRDGTYSEFLPVDYLSQRAKQLESENKTRNVALEADLQKTLDNDVANITKDGPLAADKNIESKIRAVLGDNNKDQIVVESIKHRKRVEGATATWQFTQDYFNDPSQAGKVEEEVRKWAEGSGENSKIERSHYANQILQHIANADKTLHDDSVVFFNNPEAYPDIVDAHKKWLADPENAEVRDYYFGLLDARQEQVHLSPSQRNVLSEADAKNEVARQTAIMNEAPGSMGEYFKGLQRKYGNEKYQRAITDMRMQGMDGKLEFIAADPENPFIGHLVESFKVKSADLQQLVDTPEKKAALNAAILQDDNFQAYMTDQNPDFKEGDLTNFMLRARDAVEHYVLFLMKDRGEAKDYNTAVDLTMKQFGPAYVDLSGDFTIPKTVPKKHWDAITNTTEQLKYVYGELAMNHPEIQSLVKDFMPEGASPQALGEAARNLIINHLKWKTAGDGKGLQPWIEVEPGRMIPLRDKTGKRAYHTFNQLAAPVEHQYLLNEFVPGGAKMPEEYSPVKLGFGGY